MRKSFVLALALDRSGWRYFAVSREGRRRSRRRDTFLYPKVVGDENEGGAPPSGVIRTSGR